MTNLNTSHPEPESSPGFLLWRISCQWQAAQREALAPMDLTHVQFVLLASTVWLATKDCPTQRELSDFTQVDVMTTSQVVRTLAAKGLITRNPSPTDGRSFLLAPTPDGIARANRAIAIVEKVDRDFFEPIQGDVAVMVRHMQTLIR